ncbi:hypothetical protein HYU89_03025 [Candidatus Collierbacteria bacterium]|nr:hypothetical protein [Candidatus Collierbacteria bacterium]
MKILNLVRNLIAYVIPAILRQAQDGEHRRTKAGIYLNSSSAKGGMTMVILIVLSLSFFWPVWFKGKLPIPADALVGLYHPFRDYYAADFPNGVPFKNYILTDPVLQQYPWKWLAINQLGSILKGVSFKDTPLLENPYSFGGYGASSIENIQAGTFYPLNILFFLINNFSAAWTVFIILQSILASLFMYWWLKENSLKNSAAIFGGLVWAFSSFNLVWLEWGNIGHAGLWLPLALLCVDKMQKTKNKKQKTWKWHAILQFVLSSSLFAGHLQVTLYLLMAVALYWFIRLGISKRSISLFLVFCFLFLALTSIQWIPSLKFTLSSNREVEQQDALTREGFFIRPHQLVQMISPDFFGNPSTLNYRGAWNYAEQVIYIGIIPLLFVLLGVLTKNSQKNDVDSICYSLSNLHLHRFCWSLIIIGLLFATDNPISRLPYQLKLPLISDLQPTRLSYLITFGLSSLSAFGLNEFIKNPRKLFSKVITIVVVFTVLLFALLIISSKLSPEDKLISQRNLIWPVTLLILFYILSGLFYLFENKKQKTKNKKLQLFALCSLLFVISDLFRFGWKFTPFSPKEYLYPITPAIKFLQNNIRENDRYMTLDRRILPPNANIIYELKSIEGYDPIYSKQYALLIGEMESGEVADKPQSFGRIIRPINYKSPITALLGVRYALSLSDLEEERWVKVFQEGKTRIYERR